MSFSVFYYVRPRAYLNLNVSLLLSRLYALYSEHHCRARSQRLICGLTRDTIGIYSAERETGEMVIARNETR